MKSLIRKRDREHEEVVENRDGLGQTPQMTYKKEETYGTTLGGCVSCCASILIFGYVLTILGAYTFMEPNYG